MRFESEIEELKKRLNKERIAAGGTRPRFSKETRAEVVRISANAKSLNELARQLDLNACTLGNWVNKTPQKIQIRKLIVTDEPVSKSQFALPPGQTFDVVLKNGVVLRGLPLNAAVLSILSGVVCS